MDLTNVNNVSDLMKQNETESPSESALKVMYQLDYFDAKVVVEEVIETLKGWHQAQALKCDDSHDMCQWADDAGKLDSVLMILKSID